ncbi:MAG: hypothetical protein IPK16_10650 [Anaerolineales bacterium]|nr:hypothetical protein [Anaerolineales bacterium]
MLEIHETAAWRASHPGGAIGLLELSGINNAQVSYALEARKREIEADLRRHYNGYSRENFLALPVLAAYKQYYKQFKKTYHVQLQVESIVLKGKRLPTVSPLVDANFMAEVTTFVLAAGHDVARLGPLVLWMFRAWTTRSPNGRRSKQIGAGDMIMRDRGGVSCSIIYGQDNRSPIATGTNHVVYVSYAPAGVPLAAVERHLRTVHENVRLFAPGAAVEQRRVLLASGDAYAVR